ncbi:hypothetical protein Daesc_000718 [Daldinia eschscholtzii]|uniref:Uncharacterized protein n=1 Tax=Daldinia eschscholtzii TaxID=292717 RepID=A0AAX6MZ59_9PEZI
MSDISTERDLVAERVAEALRHDFPKWVAEQEARAAAAAAREEKDAVFLFSSNWAFRPEGLQEFTTELRSVFEAVQVSYDLKTSWTKVKCLIADESKVMAACQAVLDRMVQRELSIGLPNSNKIVPAKEWRANARSFGRPTIEESMLAVAPAEIQVAASRAVWLVPRELRRKGPNPLKLVTAEVLAKLQRITGCTLVLESDALAVFIGGESVEATNVAIRKLSTLAKSALSPYKADLRCESFIYAEDQKGTPAAFTYIAHGKRSRLRSFFLDRATHDLGEKASAYGKIFEQGVVVSLPRIDSQPAKGPEGILPAISAEDRGKPYKAFSTTSWRYKPKSRLYSLNEVPPNPRDNNQVTSWIDRLPKPELMLHHGNGTKSPEMAYPTRAQLPQCTQSISNDLLKYDQSNQGDGYDSSRPPSTPEVSQQTSYEHQRPVIRPGISLADEVHHLAGSKPLHVPAALGVRESCDVPDSAEKYSADQGVNKPYQQQQEGSLISVDMEDKNHKLLPDTQTPSNPPDSKAMPDDPFAKIWNGVRMGNIRVESGVAGRPRHSTMRQQTGRRYGCFPAQSLPSNHGHMQMIPDPDPELIQDITQKLVRMMGCLEVFTGKVSLKAELGRLCLTKINHNHVCLKGTAFHDKAKSLQEIKAGLDKHHVRPRDLIFTKILTEEGGDANYIAFAEDSSGQRLWSPNARHTVYEIHCRAKTAPEKQNDFTVEVDAKDFTYRIYELGGVSSSVFVHCPKRVWDFQVTFSKLQDLRETYGSFAEDLVNGMRVRSRGLGTPVLEFIVKGVHQVEILLVRTRNIATYAWKGENAQPVANTRGPNPSASRVLEICEVHDMAPRIIGRDNNGDLTVLFERYGGNQQLGHLPTWYEVSLQSKAINEALQQNRDLELGEKVTWSPQQLQNNGALSDIITSATEMVKQIDGVGYWGDNFQDALIHGEPPSGSAATSKTRFW